VSVERRAQRSTFAERRARRAAVEDPDEVLAAAARFLESRSRSVDEVRRRLTSAGYRPALVDGAIDRLLELGMLDDRAFAEAWIASRDRARPRGERALRQELIQKGIDRELIDGLLEARRTTDDGASTEPDLEAARRLLERNARTLARVADPRQRRARAYALLARNGFDPDVCRTVAATVESR
jgi:regulatory protein